MENNRISRSESDCVVALPLDEASWQGWLAKGQVRDALFLRRMSLSFLVTPLLLAAAAGWWWFNH